MGKKRETVTVHTVSANSFGSLARWLVFSKADVVCFQEHHLAEDRLGGFQRQLKGLGWSSWLAAAIPTGRGGTTGGVGFAWKTRVDVCVRPHSLVAGRAAAMAVRTRMCGVLFVYSVYGFVGQVDKTRGMVWAQVADHADTHGFPFVVAGDHNVPAGEAPEAWPTQGVVCASKEATCRGAEGRRGPSSTTSSCTHT